MIGDGYFSQQIVMFMEFQCGRQPLLREMRAPVVQERKYYFCFDRKYSALITGGMFEDKLLTVSDDADERSAEAFSTEHAAARPADLVASLQNDETLAALPPAERLLSLRRALVGPIVFTHGFGIEGQLIFHWICERAIDIDVVTLDTGRLFPETYALWAQTERRYGRRIRAIYPHHATLERLVAKQGVDGFYESKEAREACCDTRKTKPLDRVLRGAAAWITGLRADQNLIRHEAGLIGFDTSRGLLKFNPLFDWTREAVLAEARARNVPINALHAKGFASIGCVPCTRAIQPGEPERNGRWWWENDGHRECGLHLPRRTRASAAKSAA